MNAYNDIDSMWQALLGELFGPGRRSQTSRDGAVSCELSGWSGILSDPTRNFLQNRRRALDPCYASAELLWYLSRKKTCEALLPYAPQYEKFLHDGEAPGSYGWRLAHNMEPQSEQDMLSLALCLLKKSPDTRQCYVALWKPGDLLTAFQGGCRDMPCTLGWQLMVRDSKLHWHTHMRSNDAWLGFPYDVYAFTCLQFLCAGALGVEVGPYTHFVGSMHLYERNERAAFEAWSRDLAQTPSNGWAYRRDTHDDVQRAIYLEQLNRDERIQGDPVMLGYGSMLDDTVKCCAAKWHPSSKIKSLALHNALERRRVLCSSSKAPT